MRPKDCAYIVEHLSVRFMAMVADHSRQLAEHRAAFGARTEADAKIIAGLRSEIGAARMAVLERDSLISERDGLLTQVQDMRAEIERLQWENATMHKDAEDGYAEAIKVLGDPIALSKERDALRAEVAALQERLRASIARGDFAQMEAVDLKAQLQKLTSWAAKNQSARDTMQIEIERLKSQSKAPKYKVGDKLESYNRSLGLVIPITIVGVRTVYDCQADGAEYPVGHSEDELKERYEHTPKQHPVKVGEWVRRLVPSPACDVGTVAKVVHVDDDTSEIEYDVKRIDGQHGVWFAKNCEPCDPPIVKREPTIGDTVRLVKIPIMGAVSPELQRVLEWPWIERWGTLNQTALVVEPAYQLEGALSVCLRTNVHVRWPVCCIEVVSEANHDTDAGKAVAESAVSETVAEEIREGDVVEVFKSSSTWTFLDDIGKSGTVSKIETDVMSERIVHLSEHPDDAFALRDVRKVMT